MLEEVGAIAIETTGPEVDHVIPYGGEIDEALASVVSNHQIGDEHHLMLVQWSAVYLVCPC